MANQIADPNATSVNTATTGTSSSSYNNQANANAAGATTNVYNPASTNLQSQGGSVLSQVLQSGQVPEGFGMNQQAFDALNRNLKNNVNPVLAAQYGAGSPVIGSTAALANEQLAADMSQQQWGNFNSLFNDIQNFAFSATGQTQTQSQDSTNSGNTTGNWQQQTTTEMPIQGAALGAGNSLLNLMNIIRAF